MKTFKRCGTSYLLFLNQVVANYYGNLGYYEPVPGKKIHWPGGRDTPPPDTPECGFDGTGCPTQGKNVSGDPSLSQTDQSR